MLKIRYIPPDANAYLQTELLFQELLSTQITVCGLDTETTVPNAIKDPSVQGITRTSLMQICVRVDGNYKESKLETAYDNPHVYTCFVFHLDYVYQQMKMLPPSLVKFLEKRNIIKVGCDITHDRKKLKKDFNMKPKGCVEIQDLCRSIGNLDYSLNALSEKYLKLKKLNSQFGNYDAALTTNQIEYAAYDAYLSLAVYQKIVNSNPEEIRPYFYFPQPALHPKGNPINEKEAIKFYEFLKTMNLVSINLITYEKIFNTVTNSYAEWRLDVGSCGVKIKQALKILCNMGYLVKHENGWLVPIPGTVVHAGNVNKLMPTIEPLAINPMVTPSAPTWVSMYNKDTVESTNKHVSRPSTNGNQEVTPVPFSKSHENFYNRVVGLTKKVVTVHGIKYESLVNSLDNSIQINSIGFTAGTLDEMVAMKQKYINIGIKEMVINGVLMQSAMGKLYLSNNNV